MEDPGILAGRGIATTSGVSMLVLRFGIAGVSPLIAPSWQHGVLGVAIASAI